MTDQTFDMSHCVDDNITVWIPTTQIKTNKTLHLCLRIIARFGLHILVAINYKYHDFDVNKSKRDDYDHYRTIFESDLVFSKAPGWRVALAPPDCRV